MPIIKLYRWKYFDETRGKWITTRHHAQEEDFLKHHPGAEKVPGSEETRDVPDNPADLTSGGVGRPR